MGIRDAKLLLPLLTTALISAGPSKRDAPLQYKIEGPVSVIWESVHEIQAADSSWPGVKDAVLSPDGRCLFLAVQFGTSEESGDGHLMGRTRSRIVSVDTSIGKTVWAETFGEADSVGDQVISLAISFDGLRVVAFGTALTDEAGWGHEYLAEFNAKTGTTEWQVSRPGPARGVIASHPKKNLVFVTGSRFDTARQVHEQGFVLRALDFTDGHSVWEQEFPQVAGTNLAVSSDGERLIVAGTDIGAPVLETGSSPRSDLAVCALDANTGLRQWSMRQGSGGDGKDFEPHVVLSSGSTRLFVGAQSVENKTGSGRYFIFGLDRSDGKTLWTHLYEGPTREIYSDDDLRSLTVSNDGSLVFVTGTSKGYGGSFQGFTSLEPSPVFAFRARDGREAWRASFIGAPEQVTVNPRDGTAYVVGWRAWDSNGYINASTVEAFEPTTGRTRWSAKCRGAGDFESLNGQAVVCSRDGSVIYVAGGGDVKSKPAIVTVAYSLR